MSGQNSELEKNARKMGGKWEGIPIFHSPMIIFLPEVRLRNMGNVSTLGHSPPPRLVWMVYRLKEYASWYFRVCIHVCLLRRESSSHGEVGWVPTRSVGGQEGKKTCERWAAAQLPLTAGAN